ncbi:hypothetical protein [Streptomyces sp. NRRL B-24484]|uniref:hypothetical protein n=1 Tax=Streptomyces sp. NRRL B-24484 TaxID=1463833 RepID=UPI0006934CB8|nr:hypothetical protein [Streptomyces sp. NRRL B-24484]
MTDELEGPVERVCELLSDRGIEPVVIRPSMLGSGSLGLTVRSCGAQSHAEFRSATSAAPIVVDAGTRIWCRRPAYPGQHQPLDPDAEVSYFIRAQYRSALDSLYSTGAEWMNDHAAERLLDQNKPLQNHLAARAGLTTIPTLCTDDPEAFRDFVRDLPGGGDVAIKAPAAWLAAVVDEDRSVGTFTRRFTRSEALALAGGVAKAPVLVQPYVDKDFELRVTVVGRQVFTCRIDSQLSEVASVDWRHYDLARTPHSPHRLDTDTEEGLLRFMDRSGLRYAAVDLIVTPRGDTVFVEANPSGQYTWIEALTGLPISAAIASWLTRTAGPTSG